MSLLCAVFSFVITGCTPLADRVGIFEIKSPVLNHVSCESIDDYEVCAWIETLKLRRFYPKQQNAKLYRGVEVLESRSIQLPNGFKTTFTISWIGPEEFLLGNFFDTHTPVMRELEPTLKLHGLDLREHSERPLRSVFFAGVANIPEDRHITGLVVRATCGDTQPIARAVIIHNYPSQAAMLNCLRR
jgi:hypothetical protein